MSLALEARQNALGETRPIKNAQFEPCKGSASRGLVSVSSTQNFCIPIFRLPCQNSNTHSPGTSSHDRSNLLWIEPSP
jgi:hypothetical protein